MRDDTRNYVVVGAFVIAMGAALILWIALLSGGTGATDPYSMRYANVTGLDEGTQILYEGYPVGLIEQVSRVPDDRDPHFRVDVAIQRGWRIPDDSVAEIKASGLLGGYLISIREGSSSTYLEPGAMIPSKQAADLLSTISDAADEINALIENSVRPLVDSVGQGIPNILTNLETFTQQLSQTMAQIDELLAPRNTDRVGNILANLETTSAEAAQLTEGLGETRLQLDRVLATVDRLVTENEDQLAHTLADLHHSLEGVARHIDAIVSNLEVTTRNMNEFSRQVRQNPALIVRGRSAGDGEAATP